MKVSIGRGSISPKRVGILLAISVGLMLLLPTWQENPKLSVSSVVVPLQWAVTTCVRHAASFLGLSAASSGSRPASAAELERKVAELERKLAYQEELLRDARARLANLSGDYSIMPNPTGIANVIAQDSSDWRKSLIVDRGSRNGVRVGMIAYWNGALVGRVSGVGPFACRIRTVVEPSSSISARSARSRATGILQGTGAGVCRMKYLGSEDDLQVGDQIVTAGLDRVFPPHLLLGKCIKSEASGGQLQKNVIVEPAISPLKLESVVIGSWMPPDTTVDSDSGTRQP